MSTKYVCGLLFFFCALATGMPAQAATETVLHHFRFFTRGAVPCGAPILDAANDLYGTTYIGGTANRGTVFERAASGAYRVLHSFRGGTDGSGPYAGVVRGPAGYLYGTTINGGTADVGVVYAVSSSGEETVLHSFTGRADGAYPYGGVTLDAAGNLYGTTYLGGTANRGVVFKLNPSGQLTVLHSFTGGADGANPYAGVIFDPAGNLYGTTSEGIPLGGVYKISPSGQLTVLHYIGGLKAGVFRDPAGNLYAVNSAGVFKISAAGQYTRVVGFDPTTTGGVPSAAVVMDSAGNLYGTTGVVAGSHETDFPYGGVYKVDTTGHLTMLYRFPGLPDRGTGAGGCPVAHANPGITLDATGNVYGDAWNISLGGAIYMLNAASQNTVLFRFPPALSGSAPWGGVIGDGLGNLYGTTGNGGPVNQGVLYKLNANGETALPPNAGTAGGGVARDREGNLYVTGASSLTSLGKIYKVVPSGQYSVLYSFTGGADGNGSQGVILDSAGNLYGTSNGGGAPNGCVFKLTPSGQFVVLYTFRGDTDGFTLNYDLALDSAGNLYGTTQYGGSGAGVIYKISPAGEQTVLHSFTGVDGNSPASGVILDSDGNLYGTTLSGGVENGGAIYMLSPWESIPYCTASCKILGDFHRSRVRHGTLRETCTVRRRLGAT